MQKLILPMKVHIEILPHNNKADTDLAIMHIYIDCKKELIYTAAELVNGYADIQESVYAVMWSFYLDQGIILAYCPRILLEDKKQCQEESEKIRAILAAHLK